MKFFLGYERQKLSPQPTIRQSGQIIVRQIHKTIRHYFPHLFEQINTLEDHRKRSNYQVSELVTGCIALFVFKETSRNAMNNDRKEGYFKENYVKVFGQRLPHLDTVETFLRQLPPASLEELKAKLISALIEQKVLHKLRLAGKYFTVAIDGTGAASYGENDADGSRIHKTSKNGVTTCFHYVVEAKLVTTSGLAISLASGG